MAGVRIRVIKVLNANPKTIDTARFDHQSTIGLPIATSLEIISRLTPIARGNKPNTVVNDVSKIGLSLCLQALIIWLECSKCGDSCLNLLNVSINTILLLTTIPAKVTIDKPVIVVLNGLPVIKRPKRTPTNEIVTDVRIIKDW